LKLDEDRLGYAWGASGDMADVVADIDPSPCHDLRHWMIKFKNMLRK
jgi:hypothetical protein